MYNPTRKWSGWNLTLNGVVQELPADGSTNYVNKAYCDAEGCQPFQLTPGTPESLSYTTSDLAEVILLSGSGPVEAAAREGHDFPAGAQRPAPRTVRTAAAPRWVCRRRRGSLELGRAGAE